MPNLKHVWQCMDNWERFSVAAYVVTHAAALIVLAWATWGDL